MPTPRRIAIVGATSSIAEHCARQWAASGPIDLVLVVRDRARGEQVAMDLRVRNPTATIRVVETSFEDARAIRLSVERVVSEGPMDIALIAHGSLPDQQRCQSDIVACSDALFINGISPALFAEAFAGHMDAAKRGTLALIGSVAGDRGRKSNYVYGAAKGLLARYAQGLRHRFHGTAIKIVLIEPGPTDTPMTAHLKSQGVRLATVESVAACIVAAVDRGRAVVYAPAKWRLIMMVIRHLPGAVFNRLNI